MAVPTKAGTLLAPWIKQSGLAPRLFEHRLRVDWPAIVGSMIATHSQPVRLRHHRLTIAVESPAWLHQLRYLEPTLLEQIRRAVGPEQVAELRWVVGALESHDARMDRAAVPRRPLTAEEQATISSVLAPIGDAALAATARRLLEKALARTP